IIPSAKGGHEAGPGTPALAGRLPRSILTRLRGSSGTPGAAVGRRQGRSRSRAAAAARTRAQLLSLPARAQLLSLPAPSPRLPFGGTRQAGASSSSLLSGLVIVLGAVVFGLSAVALARRRRVSGA